MLCCNGATSLQRDHQLRVVIMKCFCFVVHMHTPFTTFGDIVWFLKLENVKLS